MRYILNYTLFEVYFELYTKKGIFTKIIIQMIVAIITGDIVNSRSVDPIRWLVDLKSILATQGNEPGDWEIYRGDSFQLRVMPENALYVALLLKSTIKQYKKMDIRMGIGIGEMEYEGEKITESNGSAFIRSGECFEALKKETIAVSSPWKPFDRTINTMLALASLTMDNWSPASSEIIQLSLKKPDMKQVDLSKVLKKPQSNISIGLKRGGFDEIQKLLSYYKEEIPKI